MPTFNDQLRNRIELDEIPKRIISIVPSQSEFLWDLGIRENLVGISKFCIHPSEMFRTIERVGGTKKLDLEKIRTLNPDLIIGNKEENSIDDIVALQKEFRVWMSDITSLDDMYAMMNSLALIFEKQKEGSLLVQKLEASLNRLKNVFQSERVLYFIWKDPYMVAANGTFINSVLQLLGLSNAAASRERYPVLTPELIQKLDPELCFLSGEPFPFREKHLNEFQTLLPKSKIVLVDGELFSWYGTRLLQLEGYIEDLVDKLHGG
ncbi:MAG: helical backbone metal receptor [bacterium]|nr:helical backbone metal receptor [bacterium]